MKKIFLIGFVALWASLGVWAQDLENPQIQAMRKEFFERELQLSPQESQAFWPLFDEYRLKQRDLKGKVRDGRKLELMSDAEAERFLEENFDLEEKQLALKREYFGKLKEVMNVRKIAMINRTERKFKKSLLHKLQERRRGNGRHNGFN